LTHIEGIVIEG